MKRSTALLALPALVVMASCSGESSTQESASPSILVVPSVPPGVTATPGQPMDDPVAQPSPSPAAGPVVDKRKDQPIGKAGTPRGQVVAPASKKTGSPDQVAQTFVTTLWTWDAKLDTGPNDAGRRAAVLAAPTYAKALTEARSKAAPNLEWTQMVSHHGFTKITEVKLGGLGDPPPDTATAAARAVTVKGSFLGDKKWSSALGPHTLLVYMQKTSGRWLVTRTEVLS